jgi:ribulose 1,5-bisphosphate carboxylase large subunit-like protein
MEIVSSSSAIAALFGSDVVIAFFGSGVVAQPAAASDGVAVKPFRT